MNKFDSVTFARRLKALREERGMDQNALASKSGVSRDSIARYEMGTNTPRADIVVSLARALGCSCDVLMGVVPLAVA